MRSLGDDADKVSALFVSVDPERDTPDKLKNYVPFFSPDLIGLTGSVSEITTVADAYRVQTKIHSRKKDSDYYLVFSNFMVATFGSILYIPFVLACVLGKTVEVDIRPIIAQTAYAISGDKEKALAAGCDNYISKPIKKEVLMDMIHHFLG